MELTVSDFLSQSELEGVRLVAGRNGTDRVITRTNVIDNPDTLDWLMPGEFLLSTGYIFQQAPSLQRTIIQSLAEINCAGLCLKIGRYLSCVPADMAAEADRLDFPLIELPFGYSLSEATGIINRWLFSDRDQQLEQTLAIHREVMQTALTSGGLFKLTETLVRLIGNPVLVTDSSWNPLCHVDRPDNPFPLAEHLNLSGKYPPFSEAFLATLPDGLRNYKKPVTRVFPIEGRGNVNCRFFPITAHSFHYGYIIVWEAVRELRELDYVALDQVAIVAALERIRAKEVEQTKLRIRKDFLDDLLSGTIESQNAIRSLAKLHGLHFDSCYRCLVVRPQREDAMVQEHNLMDGKRSKFSPSVERLAESAAQAAKEVGLNIVNVPRGLQLVILADLGQGTEKRLILLRRMTQRLVELLAGPAEDARFLIVVGKSVPTLAEVSKSLRNAQNGVHMVHTTGIRDDVVFMDDFAAYQLLRENIDRDSLLRFCKTSIGPLLTHDQKNGTQFTETLENYFSHNGSISDAAKDMYIHRNTYIYRLEKIKALLDTDLKNSRKLLELQLGLLAHRILEE